VGFAPATTSPCSEFTSWVMSGPYGGPNATSVRFAWIKPVRLPHLRPHRSRPPSVVSLRFGSPKACAAKLRKVMIRFRRIVL
jgi:hypothetical protein